MATYDQSRLLVRAERERDEARACVAELEGLWAEREQVLAEARARVAELEAERERWLRRLDEDKTADFVLRVAELEAENERLEDVVADLAMPTDDQERLGVSSYRAHAAKLEAALREYGQHKRTCEEMRLLVPTACTCGFRAALREASR